MLYYKSNDNWGKYENCIYNKLKTLILLFNRKVLEQFLERYKSYFAFRVKC